MKFVVVLFALSVAVMVAMIFQILRQEFEFRDSKVRRLEDLAVAKREEKVIDLIKPQIRELRTNLASVMGRVDALKKRKAAAEKTEQDRKKDLEACGKDKESTEKKKKAVVDSMAKLKADHAAEKTKAEEELKSLKQQILDRDKAVCVFADPSIAEARRLCGINAPQ
ncbi:uncharacterized protein si:dkey-87o1.2 [Dunckerocampus dactyliophorus]|uniref:uncharacterized protein si:dkey-87o1.2 n=1 Tax=Dunckerocampus dactyliophorus TaxID=161453 RepID=UPI002406D3A0|nr:uncharacterized protein si:dkey-87o1.2 [Dunckerocampus dactyliophorus]